MKPKTPSRRNGQQWRPQARIFGAAPSPTIPTSQTAVPPVPTCELDTDGTAIQSAVKSNLPPAGEAGFQVVREEIRDTGESEIVVSFPTKQAGRGEIRMARSLLADTSRAKAKFVGHGASIAHDWPAVLRGLSEQIPKKTLRRTQNSGWHGDEFVSIFGTFTKANAEKSIVLDAGKFTFPERDVAGSVSG